MHASREGARGSRSLGRALDESAHLRHAALAIVLKLEAFHPQVAQTRAHSMELRAEARVTGIDAAEHRRMASQGVARSRRSREDRAQARIA